MLTNPEAANVSSGKRAGRATSTRPIKRELNETPLRPGYLVRRLHQRFANFFSAACDEFDLTPIQSSVLRSLALSSPQDLTRLGESVYIDRTTTGQVVRRLERRGLVECAQDERDARRTVVALSKAGKVYVRAMRKPTALAHQQFMEPLSPAEREQFIALAKKLLSIKD